MTKIRVKRKQEIVLFLLLPTKQRPSLSFCGSLCPNVLVQGVGVLGKSKCLVCKHVIMHLLDFCLLYLYYDND